MNKLQLNNFKVLHDSYEELKEVSINTIDTVVLLEKLGFLDTTALAIRDWSQTLSNYYYAKKAEIEADETGSVYINFDEIGSMPHTMDELKDSQKGNLTSDYRIAKYVDIPFIDTKINRVDFGKDLKYDIAVDKVVKKDIDGRPIKVEYLIENKVVAVIYFEFETQLNNLVAKKTEYLVYIKNDGTEGLRIKRKVKTYNLNNEADTALIDNERVDGRGYLVSVMKIHINGVLIEYLPDLSQYAIIEIIKPYWKDIKDYRDDFIDFGLEYWEESLKAMPTTVTDTSILWMNYPINAEGETIKDYMIAVLSY